MNKERQRIRNPRTAAVMLKCDEEGPTYAEVLGFARKSINLQDLGITDTKIRRAQSGSILIEIPGENAASKAENLKERLNAAYQDSDHYGKVNVIRPKRRAELRIIDIDEFVEIEEVKKAVSESGGVSLTEIRTGPLRKGRGVGTIWVQCPVDCANRLNKMGKIRMGWSVAKVIPLARRRLQCYRCLAVGYTRINCRSIVDRSHMCFNCGKDDGHVAFRYKAPPRCPICQFRGLKADHRAGAEGCMPYNGPGGKVNVRQTATGEETAMETEVNVNRSRPAQDLIQRTSEEYELGIVVISKSHSIPDDGRWVASSDSPTSAAITWQWTRSNDPCTLAWRDEKHVAVEWGELTVVSCYLPPSLDIEEYKDALRKLEHQVKMARPKALMIAGDFNARSPAWDRGEGNRRGRILLDWIGKMDLQILNDGISWTCVHPRGNSCVDITLVSSNVARRVEKWRVLEEAESLSDHRYVHMSLLTTVVGPVTRNTALKEFPRWVTKKVNVDMMEAAAEIAVWTGIQGNFKTMTKRIDRIMTDISDVSMRRKGSASRPSTYWWNEEIAKIRSKCNSCRRQLKRELELETPPKS
ncbi:uncharacterized protein [Mycetomoellerius zeteki]|uniref:uncharacterized protein n=1 Tax=Mycetomoellerius zeteki TaxID=64791 RepID=UPI00084E4FED|nr:PREDICTED: uncharacterized protein LOC108728271 [Trachymyrmex zeteki]